MRLMRVSQVLVKAEKYGPAFLRALAVYEEGEV